MTDHGLPYRTVTLPGFPGASMVAFGIPGEAPVGLGAHHGLPDGNERIVTTHRDLCRSISAERVSEDRAGVLTELLRGYGGFRGMRDPMGRGADASVDAVAEAMRDAIATRDAYRAARHVEDRSGVEADTRLVDLMREAVLRMETMALRDDVGAEAARLMERGTPGPGTLLSRMLAAWRDGPLPSEEGIVRVPPPREMDGWSCVVLGTLAVTPSADALRWTGPRLPVEVTVRVLLDPVSVETGPDGTVAEASLRMDIVYDPATHDAGRDGHLYADPGVEGAVRDLLTRHGLPGTPAWSESGRQDWRFGDMDLDCDIVPVLWPDSVPEPRAGASGP